MVEQKRMKVEGAKRETGEDKEMKKMCVCE